MESEDIKNFIQGAFEETVDLEVQAKISIPGFFESLSFKTLELDQCFFDHHKFVIVTEQPLSLGDFFSFPEKNLSLINKKIIIDIQQGYSLDALSSTYLFSGVISNVQIINENGAHGCIRFEGYSPTIKLDRGKMMQSYSKTTIKNILDIVTKLDSNQMSTEINPVYDGSIDFALQFDETDWTFTQRLCKMFGETLFYSGSNLVIGSYIDSNPTVLQYDKGFNKIEMGSRLVSSQLKQYYYDRESNDSFKSDTLPSPSNPSFFIEKINEESNKLNQDRKPNIPINAPVPNQDKMSELTNMRKSSEVAKMLYVSGECRTCNVHIGKLLSISLPSYMSSTPDIGIYRVIKVTHSIDNDTKKYKNTFEAIPSNLKYMPYRDIELPHPYPIQAIVTDNGEDLGRCKVKFPFDTIVCETLIPVMTPDAGNGGTDTTAGTSSNRGFVFIPEKGDQVLISFLDGQWLSQPYISGSLFHKGNASNLANGVGNYIKTITDKSGGQILMNSDVAGDWSIKIHDKNGNVIVLDTKAKNIEITAPENITLTSKKISLKATEMINIDSDDKYNLVAKTGDEQFSDNLTTTVTNLMKQVSANIEIENQETLIKSSTKVEVKSPDTDFGI